MLSKSHPNYSTILRLHDQAVQSGIPTYQDPQTGLAVMTAAFLANQQICCSNGCRHCPFEVE
ncbi:MAG: DUF5522 domain-containing protein [Ilumatobacteraceae bacterium]